LKLEIYKLNPGKLTEKVATLYFSLFVDIEHSTRNSSCGISVHSLLAYMPAYFLRSSESTSLLIRRKVNYGNSTIGHIPRLPASPIINRWTFHAFNYNLRRCGPTRGGPTNYAGLVDTEVERRARLCQLRNLPPVPRVNLEPMLSKAQLHGLPSQRNYASPVVLSFLIITF